MDIAWIKLRPSREQEVHGGCRKVMHMQGRSIIHLHRGQQAQQPQSTSVTSDRDLNDHRWLVICCLLTQQMCDAKLESCLRHGNNRRKLSVTTAHTEVQDNRRKAGERPTVVYYNGSTIGSLLLTDAGDHVYKTSLPMGRLLHA
jgi:hypothetical protein